MTSLKEELHSKLSTLRDIANMPKYLDLTNDNLDLSFDNMFSCLHLNVRGLISKTSELKLLMSQLDKHNVYIDVLCLCETFLTCVTQNSFNIRHSYLD